MAVSDDIRIVAWRDFMGFSQQQAAYSLGISVRTLQRMEGKPPSGMMLAAMRGAALGKLCGEHVRLTFPWEHSATSPRHPAG